MGRYAARRLLQMIPIFIGTTLLIFLMVHILPGDPVRAIYGDKAPDPAQIAQIKREYGFDKPVLEQYVHYMWNLLQGDFGKNLAGRPVAELMSEAFPVTLRLTLLAITIEIIIGVGLGAWAGLRAGRAADTGVLVFTLTVISIPVFVLGFIARFIFADELGWLPPNVQDSTDFSQLFLPAFVLAMLSMAYVARLRNSLIPVVTFIGTDVGGFIGGAVITEGIFNIQGVGNLLYRAIQTSEGSTVTGVVTVLVLVILLINLLIDLLYAVLDPRIRYA
jgi:oligopeptide transport system permease protein